MDKQKLERIWLMSRIKDAGQLLLEARSLTPRDGPFFKHVHWHSGVNRYTQRRPFSDPGHFDGTPTDLVYVLPPDVVVTQSLKINFYRSITLLFGDPGPKWGMLDTPFIWRVRYYLTHVTAEEL